MRRDLLWALCVAPCLVLALWAAGARDLWRFYRLSHPKGGSA